MAEAELGTTFDIHGGGSDLVFPHHENEIAQSEAARGEPLARVWMHNGMVLAGPEAKMAKSVGNVFLLHEALDRYGSEAIVDFLLSGHYRQPLAFGDEQLEEARVRVGRLRNFLRDHLAEEGGGSGDPPGEGDPYLAERRTAFFDALADDFNTPRARAELFDLVAEANRREVPGAGAAVVEMLDVFGLGSLAESDDGPDPEAQALLEKREAARAERDFATADELRDELAAMGWEVRDSAEGARLVRR
jgi:cysteinyl-tRNA synthetase